MAISGQTFVRFCGALLLGLVANRVDHPRSSDGEAPRSGTLPVVVAAKDMPDGSPSAGLEVKITPGKRAYGIRVNDAATLAGLIQPNSRVDILVVISDPNDGGKRVAKLFMSNMRVLAIGPTRPPAADGRPIDAAVATIEVTPEESEQLAIATTQGQLQLVLRGYGDSDPIERRGDAEMALQPPRGPYVRGGPCARSGRDSIFRNLLRTSECVSETITFQKDSTRSR